MKLAVIVLSDPKNGEEALGRVFNALALAAEARVRHEEVEVVFQGAGTRWPALLSQPGHRVHALYDSVRPSVAGVSCGCAAAFGETENAKACGLPELKDNALSGTPGLSSTLRYLAEGWTTLVF